MNDEQQAFEHYLVVREGKQSGSTLLGYDEIEARRMCKRILDQFVTEGHVIHHRSIVPDVWIAECGADYTVLEMLTVGIN